MGLSGGALPSGTSSGSSHDIQTCASEGDLELQARMERKRKRRMESNRVSAKRSRERKQQHLNDLTSQVDQLKMKNQHLITALNIAAQNSAVAEAHNSVLRTRRMELESRLAALREIIYYMDANQFASSATITNPATTQYDAFNSSAWYSGSECAPAHRQPALPVLLGSRR
ncbi:hypothetical protein ACP4OV_027730 [Aristida adscensionis]